MTAKQRQEFVAEFGYEPCFKVWSQGGVDHCCKRADGHEGPCICGCACARKETQ